MTIAQVTDTDFFPPGPPPRTKGVIPSLRYYFNFINDPIGFIESRFEAYGDIYCVHNPNGELYVIRHPDHIREVLLTRADDFDKKHSSFDSLTQVLGESLLTSDGESWKRQRRMVQPAFTRKRLSGYGKIMADESERIRDRWKPYSKVDMGREMIDLTLSIVCRTLFSYQPSNETDQVAKAMQTFNDALASPNILPEWLPTPNRIRVTRAIDLLNKIIFDIIKERRESTANSPQPEDLLQRLITAVDPENNDHQLSDNEIRDQLMTLFLAGHETTSHALTWTWYLLAQNPRVEEKLHQELDLVLAGRAPSYEDLSSLPYTEQVIKEAMRLYPPAYVLTRRARCSTEVGGYHLPAGSELVIWLYMTHHDARWFPEPEVFKPERFEPEAVAKLPKLAYLPFGGGPRTCIGGEFAMVEARLILATLAQTFRPTLLSQQPVGTKPRITLAPKSAIKMILKPR